LFPLPEVAGRHFIPGGAGVFPYSSIAQGQRWLFIAEYPARIIKIRVAVHIPEAPPLLLDYIKAL
jgi:hypothetical protein